MTRTPSWAAGLVVAVVVAVATTARADDSETSGKMTGHFPVLTASVQAGMDMTPVGFTDNDTPDQETSISAVVGPDIVADFDTHKFLLELEGLYNPLGDLRWTAGAHVTFGFRTTHHLIKSISDSPANASGEFTRTTTVYTNRDVPAYFGITGGVSLWGFDTTTFSSIDGASGSRSPSTLPVVDIGLAIQSPQLLLAIAPEYDLSGDHLGMHYAFGIGFPVGDHMLSMRFTADQLFGDDAIDNSGRRTQVIMMFSLGLSTSIGLPGL